jgi:RNA polymerase sigma-70 factor (ECF subfamily)
MWQKFGEFDLATNFLSWACRIAYFEAKNFVRKKKTTQVEHVSDLLDAFAHDEYVGRPPAERETALRQCLTKLAAADRKLLDGVYRDGLSVTRLAEILGRTRRSVSNSLSRIRGSLLVCIERVVAVEGSS